jgi:membrane protein DedA with SNARE-associated domain
VTLADAIEHYGYLAVAVGTFLEGETVLVLAGFAARRGHLDLAGVIAAAFVGSLFGDQLYFWIGRRHGAAWLARRPGWQPRVARVQRMLHAHQTPIVLGFRFLYGLRTVVPFALGMSGVPLRRFVPLNACAVAAWAIATSCLGWALGSALERLLGDLERYEVELFLAIAAAGAVFWLVRRGRAAQGALPA